MFGTSDRRPLHESPPGYVITPNFVAVQKRSKNPFWRCVQIQDLAAATPTNPARRRSGARTPRTTRTALVKPALEKSPLVTEEEAVDLYHGSVVAQHSAMVYQLKMDSRLVGAVLRGIEDDKYGISLYVLHTLCLGLARIH